LAIALLSAALAHAQLPTTTYNGRTVVDNEVLIRLKNVDSATRSRAVSLLPSGIFQELSRSLGIHRVRLPGAGVAALISIFARSSDLLYVEPNHVRRITSVPNDSLYGLLWGMPKISAPAAWNVTTGARSAVIGVIDTGIDYTHPDLAPNVWSAPAQFTVTVAGQAITCPAGSHGFNAILLTCDPKDDHNHGSHVAGTIGAAGNNGIGVAGVNWTASMMGLKFLDSSGSGSDMDAVNAMEFALQVKALFAGTATPVNVRVMSASWGGAGFSQALLDQINRLNDNDVLFVTAAGNAGSNNDTTPVYPANLPASNIIAVAATGSSDLLASFSNFSATKVHLGAPGVGIYSTIVGSGYGSLSGTSMATPHVSGAALLTLANCSSLNTAGLKNAILNSADPIPSLAGKTITGARLNVDNAVRSCMSQVGTASFVRMDTTTQGNWRSMYGVDGHVVIGDNSSNPSYVSPAVIGAATYVWANSTPDVRALQKGSNPADRIAGTWYGTTPFTIDLNNSDTAQHQISLYCLDWDSVDRRQTVDILDVNGNVLNTQTITGFNGGVYLVWNVSGHVKVRVTFTGGWNAVVSGLFFGGATAVLGAPQSIVAVSGTPQSATVGASFGAPLQAKVTDGSGIGVPGVSVTFTAPGSAASATMNGNATATAITNGSGVAISPVPLANSVPGTYIVTAAVNGLASANFTLTNTAPVAGASAAFVRADTTTLGNWRTGYGADGFVVIGDQTSNPAYVTPLVSGQAAYVWASSTTDVRALQKASFAGDRIAGTWYNTTPFTIDLNIGDGAQHQVALYCLDWDTSNRRQTVDVLDANNNVLNSRILSTSFNGGVYLVWNVSGHVKIRVTWSGGFNGVASGLFFGVGTQSPPPPATPQSIIAFSGTPASATVSTSFSSSLQAKVTDGAANPLSGVSVTFTAPATGAGATFSGSNTFITTTNAFGIATTPVPLANGLPGSYIVTAVVTGLTPANFSLTNTAAPPPSGGTAVFVRQDTTTQGNWRGVYGLDGYVVIGDQTSNPSYVSPIPSGHLTYVWTNSTTDVRALQKGSNANDRIAATWYNTSPFTIDLNITDAATHQIALYCLDWDSVNRRQTVDILDSNGNVLNSQVLPANFSGGVYLVWNVSGQVKIRVSWTSGYNAVVSGLFFR